MSTCVTTIQSADPKLIDKAKSIAEALGTDYYDRRSDSVNHMIEKYGVDSFVVVQKERLILKDLDETIYWHPGMAIPRIKDVNKGAHSPLVEAADLKKGDSVLDCTLGFGGDALFMASVVGIEGEITGLESDRRIAILSRYGIEAFLEKDKKGFGKVIDETDFCKAINVWTMDHRAYLKQQADNSYDVVYLDPMFVVTRRSSSDMASLKRYADDTPLNREVLHEATRVARRRVVVKECLGNGILEWQEFDGICGQMKKGKVAYGYIDAGGNG